nr:hypothetical protein [uncultured Draconibacterium sp.]
MGLFNKVELKKEYFEPAIGFDKVEVSNLRKRQGFKVDIINSNEDIYVKATISGGVLKKIQIEDVFRSDGIRLCAITIYSFTHSEVKAFLNKKFSKSGELWRLTNTELLSFEGFKHDMSRCFVQFHKKYK